MLDVLSVEKYSLLHGMVTVRCVDVLSVGRCSEMGRRGVSPKKDPLEPPEPCPECGEQPPPTEESNKRTIEECTLVDIVCTNCGTVLEHGHLIDHPEPDVNEE